MDEPPKIHHHKSKQRRSSSRRTGTENNNVSVLKGGDDTVGIDEMGEREASSSTANNEEVVPSIEKGEVKNVPANETTSADKENIPEIAITEEPKIHKGILGFMDREIKSQRKPPQSLSDPTASPAQRSIRSRSSIEKSPRQKRSKSESRRRRERKLIAAGELEVKQANETLMRYLKQCTEINDASLSGELEIDKSLDDRRVHRKTKRERRSHGSSIGGSGGGNGGPLHTRINGHTSGFNRDRLPPSGLSSILQELASDVVPGQVDIYNPFTPVISPTDGTTRTDRMFIQTSNGFRPVNDNTFFKDSMHDDTESNRSSFSNGVSLSCIVQRVWILFSNICHGLLGGLALAHILFLVTTTPADWAHGSIKHYSAFAELYTNTFYCLAIICLVSILDRMDICHWNLTTSVDTISFRWIIIVMLYLSTIILSLSAESMDERLYLNQKNSTVWEHESETNKVHNIWNSLSLARSVAAIIGWILIGLTATDDHLYHHLLEMEKHQLNNN